jgi:hypothetical protein
MDQLSEANREALSIFEKNNVPLLSMSAVTDEGVMEVKQQVILILFIFLIFYVYKFGFIIRHVILSWLIALKTKSKLRRLIQF